MPNYQIDPYYMQQWNQPPQQPQLPPPQQPPAQQAYQPPMPQNAPAMDDLYSRGWGSAGDVAANVWDTIDAPGALLRGLLAGRPGERLTGESLGQQWGWLDPEGSEGDQSFGHHAGAAALGMIDPLSVIPLLAALKKFGLLGRGAMAGAEAGGLGEALAGARAAGITGGEAGAAEVSSSLGDLLGGYQKQNSMMRGIPIVTNESDLPGMLSKGLGSKQQAELPGMLSRSNGGLEQGNAGVKGVEYGRNQVEKARKALMKPYSPPQLTPQQPYGFNPESLATTLQEADGLPVHMPPTNYASIPQQPYGTNPRQAAMAPRQVGQKFAGPPVAMNPFDQMSPQEQLQHLYKIGALKPITDY